VRVDGGLFIWILLWFSFINLKLQNWSLFTNKFIGDKMKLNKNQKRTILIGAVIIVAALIVWVGYGMEIFTKTQVIVEKTDELFGTTYKEFEDKFVLGLDYSAAFSFAVLVISLIIAFFQRTKREKEL